MLLVTLPGAFNSSSHLYVSSSNYNNHMYFSLALLMTLLELLSPHLKHILVIIIIGAHTMGITLIGNASEGW